MRTAARLQAVTSELTDQAFDYSVECIRAWESRKLFFENGKAFKRADGSEIEKLETSESYRSEKLFEYELSEVVEEALVTLNIKILRSSSTIIQCEVRAGSALGGFSDVEFEAQAPNFFRDIISSEFDWRFRDHADKIFSVPFNVSLQSYDDFIDLLQDPRRCLPVLAVTKGENGEIVRNIGAILARRLCGLSHVCVLNSQVSWKLTEDFDKEWSVFGGAIRLYWPRTFGIGNPFKHKIWIHSRLQKLRPEAPNAESRIGRLVSRPIIDVSTFIPTFTDFEEFKRKAANQKIEELREQASADNDFSQLAEAYAKENDRLKSINDELSNQVDTLSDNVTALLKTSDKNFVDHPAADPEIEDFSSLSEAIEQARAACSGRLRFSDNLKAQAESINEKGIQPSKLYDYLLILNELSLELEENEGALGQTTVQWLKERGFECSGESSSRKANGLFSFPMRGETKEFELHLKPNEGTAPDRCVRIYFAVGSAPQYYIDVGFVGSKRLLER